MIKNLLLFIIFTISVVGVAQPKSDKILGIWLSEDKEGHIEIYKKENKYYGKLVWLKIPNDKEGKPKTDKNNSDPKLSSRPVMEMDIILDLIYKDGEWSNGKIYDPHDGKTYTCVLWLEKDNLRLRGYWGWFFVTETWTRVRY